MTLGFLLVATLVERPLLLLIDAAMVAPLYAAGVMRWVMDEREIAAIGLDRVTRRRGSKESIRPEQTVSE